MPINKGPEKISDIFKQQADKIKRQAVKRAPAFVWQDLALKVIEDLNIPDFKRSSVFKVCKQKPRVYIEKCLNDTKELCRSGEPWKYFFKIIGSKGEKL